MSRHLLGVVLGSCLIVAATGCQSTAFNEVRKPVTFDAPLAIPPVNAGTLPHYVRALREQPFAFQSRLLRRAVPDQER